ncbi:hypothetical protein NMD46_05505 [Escherichia coli]|uniref:hypothetical protein n=1 Tax=Escherichia coli TaxID=562 RepID=UPI00351D49A6
MEPLLPDDTLWRNLRLVTLDPAQTAPYGMLDHHALIIRKGTFERNFNVGDWPTFICL